MPLLSSHDRRFGVMQSAVEAAASHSGFLIYNIN